MKKPLVVSIILVLTLLMAGFCTPAYSQAPKDDTPTFYRLVPGTYVNRWPRFTIHYPKEWVERPTAGGSLFQASSPGPAPQDGCAVYVIWEPLPLDKYAGWMVTYNKRMMSTDVTLVNDKPSRLRDGTPARELEFKMVRNGEPFSSLLVA